MSKKAEKRLAAKALKLSKTLSKTIRQLEEPLISKNLGGETIAEPVKKVKQPNIEKGLAAHLINMTYSMDMKDEIGEWSWGEARKCNSDVWGNDVKPFLEHYSTKRWVDIDNERTGKGKKRRSKHCFYSYDK